LSKNFLPSQYEDDKKFSVQHNYLGQQFSDKDLILEKIKEVVTRGDFTLGREVDKLEEAFAQLVGAKHAIGVGSGTDAIFLSLRALDLQPGDEVITTSFTFYATIGAIVTAGGTPVFCDIEEDFNISIEGIKKLITDKTKAIVPVHWSGRPCEMNEMMEISVEFGIPIIEDACHSILAEYHGKRTGTFGITGCFSFHPLKNLNVWGDGGIITTNSDDMNAKIRLLRNHGLTDRDHCEIFGYNSRLDTIQAVVASHLLEKIDSITDARIDHANYLDRGLSEVPGIKIPQRVDTIKEVFHIYSFMAESRDALVQFLRGNGIDAKIHYPIPMHLQPAAEYLNYKKGDFPMAENAANRTISLPVHEFVESKDLDFMISKVREFYSYGRP
jgi:dTDP-3-amino-2,3,6-trideoxy-4-keto-D-glucose/dTDP-3-amino-3,4,6-trideoxy-alpha-D-glucose/dTDP-2,6-dideoxy-D-kanosamine transaminase